MGSNRQKKDTLELDERLTSLMSSVSAWVKKFEESVSKLQPAYAGRSSNAATTVALFHGLIESHHKEVLKTLDAVNHLNSAITYAKPLHPRPAPAVATPSPQNQGVLLNPETNVGCRTKKRRLKEQFQNNELPETLEQLNSASIKRILAEIVDQNTNVKWGDIAGLEYAKNCVLETALWPVQNPRIFQGVRSIGKGILLFGPPGTGKTMLGKAIAGEMQAALFNLSATSLTSQMLVESDQLVTALFALARHLHPSVIFLDDMDALLSRQSSYDQHNTLRRVKMQLLIEMQDIDSGSEQVIVIGATNRPQDPDEAARRRLSKRLYIPLPSRDARYRIVLNTLEKVGQTLSEQELSYICSLTDGYSGSDMKNLIHEAMMGPVRDAIKNKNIHALKPEELRPLALQDFTNALREVRPSVSLQELVSYAEWNTTFGSN